VVFLLTQTNPQDPVESILIPLNHAEVKLLCHDSRQKSESQHVLAARSWG
jgi:hypothetical protein